MNKWKGIFKKSSIKSAFISGLIVAIPLGITIFTLQFIFRFVDNIFGKYFREFLPFYIPGIGIITTFFIILVLGALINNWLGRKFYEKLEKRMSKLPLLGSLYTVSRQIVEIIGSSRRKEFQKVIYLQYPAEGIWTLGFVTGQSISDDGKRIYNVFVPTTPNPTSGYMVFIPHEDAIDTSYTIEEGLKILISGGMLAPPRLPFPVRKKLVVHKEEPLPEETDKAENEL